MDHCMKLHPGPYEHIKSGYTQADIATAHPSDMDAYYSAQEQSQYGVVGIEISVL